MKYLIGSVLIAGIYMCSPASAIAGCAGDIGSSEAESEEVAADGPDEVTDGAASVLAGVIGLGKGIVDCVEDTDSSSDSAPDASGNSNSAQPKTAGDDTTTTTPKKAGSGPDMDGGKTVKKVGTFPVPDDITKDFCVDLAQKSLEQLKIEYPDDKRRCEVLNQCLALLQSGNDAQNLSQWTRRLALYRGLLGCN